MANRINRAIELLQQGQAIYYDGPHSGHVLTYEQGREDAGTWADYINVGMEHGAFDMTGLAAYMRGLVDGAEIEDPRLVRNGGWGGIVGGKALRAAASREAEGAKERLGDTGPARDAG